MNQKGIAPLAIVAIIVVAAVVVGVGVYVATRGEGVPGEGEGEGEGEGVGEATSLAYTVEMSSAATGTITSRFRVRNIGTANMDMRVDMTTAYGTMSYILSGSQHEGWVKPNGGWLSFSSFDLDFDEQWNQQSGAFEQYTGYLSGWTEGEWSGTFGGYTYRIYDIQVNPSLPDSVFQPS